MTNNTTTPDNPSSLFQGKRSCLRWDSCHCKPIYIIIYTQSEYHSPMQKPDCPIRQKISCSNQMQKIVAQSDYRKINCPIRLQEITCPIRLQGNHMTLFYCTYTPYMHTYVHTHTHTHIPPTIHLYPWEEGPFKILCFILNIQGSDMIMKCGEDSNLFSNLSKSLI